MIIATAGHVDHGKTSLVRNLTGIETDRLAEEQRRGLSINLGYAYWKITDHLSLGFIDVPGHRRFINTMISGVSGIDLGLLVLAADDGVMPQTIEHIQLMTLLGVKHFLLVLSKCDRVDAQRIEEVSSDALALLPSDTSIFNVSNTTGMGLDALKRELLARGKRWSARTSDGHFRMSVDRAFNLQGQGLVVTGFAQSGSVSMADTLLLQPQNIPVRVRSIRAQDTNTDTANAGQRIALNISGSAAHSVHRDDIERGDWLVEQANVPLSSRFDARVTLLNEAPFSLKRISNVKLHIGAKRLSARLIVLGAGDAKLRAGESTFAQLVTERPIICCFGDRFILRDSGETATLGGGTVIEPIGLKHRKSSDARLQFLAAMEHTDHKQAIQQALRPERGVLNYTAFLHARNLKSEAQREGENPGTDLADIARLTIDGREYWLPAPYWQAIKTHTVSSLHSLHKKFPSEPGIKPALLKKEALATTEKHFFQAAVIELLKEGLVLMNNGLLSSPSHTTKHSVQASPEWQKIAQCLQQQSVKIPSVSQLQQESGIEPKALQQALQLATRNQQLIKLNEKRYALPTTVAQFARAVLTLNTEGKELTVIQYRDHMICGRNLAIEVLEYFDAIRFTQRRGESRIILDKTIPTTLFSSGG